MAAEVARTRSPIQGRRLDGSVIAAVATACSLLSLCGCVGLEGFVNLTDSPPTGTVCQIVATWNKEVMFAPDPANGGRPSPGITGRLYLFGPQIDVPLACEGSLTVDLFIVDQPSAASPPDKGGGPRLLEEWRLDKNTLHCLLRKDPIGWGYTLFLPWGTYRPEIKQIRLKLRYDPPQGAPLYTESGIVSLSVAK
jgi:hypothetical protein